MLPLGPVAQVIHASNLSWAHLTVYRIEIDDRHVPDELVHRVSSRALPSGIDSPTYATTPTLSVSLTQSHSSTTE